MGISGPVVLAGALLGIVLIAIAVLLSKACGGACRRSRASDGADFDPVTMLPLTDPDQPHTTGHHNHPHHSHHAHHHAHHHDGGAHHGHVDAGSHHGGGVDAGAGHH